MPLLLLFPKGFLMWVENECNPYFSRDKRINNLSPLFKGWTKVVVRVINIEAKAGFPLYLCKHFEKGKWDILKKIRKGRIN